MPILPEAEARRYRCCLGLLRARRKSRPSFGSVAEVRAVEDVSESRASNGELQGPGKARSRKDLDPRLG